MVWLTDLSGITIAVYCGHEATKQHNQRWKEFLKVATNYQGNISLWSRSKFCPPGLTATVLYTGIK